MAKFITTKQITSELENLIKKAEDRLYLISPYLKLSKDFRELLVFRNASEKKTKIFFGKQELNPEQMHFLQGLRHVYLFFYEDLHAKCYINDSKMIITSMNFYEYSMINNREMGILIDTSIPEDSELYSDAWEEIKLIEMNSKHFDFISKPLNNQTAAINESKVEGKPLKSAQTDTRLLSTTALSKEMGLSSKELFAKFEQFKWIERKGEEWELTGLGRRQGAQTKKGQYGDYIAWPETISSSFN